MYGIGAKKTYVQKLFVFLLILCIYFLFHDIATNVPRVFITFVEGMHNMRFLFFIPNAYTVLNCHFVHL